MSSIFARFEPAADWLTDMWVPAFIVLLVAATLQHDPRLASDLSYILILVFLVGGIPLGLRRSGGFDRSRFTVIPLVLMGLWAYGVILGLGYGWPPNAVFRNFAAMSLFFVYYVLVLLSPQLRHIQVALYVAAAAMVLSVVYLIFTGTTRGTVGEIGFVAMRYHYFLGSIVAGAAMFALTVRSLVTGPFRLWQVVFGLAIFVAIFLSGSRAFYLALFGSMVVIGLSFLPSQRWRFLRAVGLGLGYAGLALLLTVRSAGTSGAVVAVTQSVASETAPASPRLDQFEALVREITFFGKGLGASLDSGYSRDALGYGFELSYLSLAHKVGIVGLIVFLSCAAVHVLRSVKTMTRDDHSAITISGVALMSFLLSSWGNPTLFAPIFVCFFCVSLYIERTVAVSLTAR